MTDNVNIASVAFNGSDLPKWATEKTLKDLLSVLEKAHGLDSKQLGALNDSLGRIADSAKDGNTTNDDLLDN